MSSTGLKGRIFIRVRNNEHKDYTNEHAILYFVTNPDEDKNEGNDTINYNLCFYIVNILIWKKFLFKNQKKFTIDFFDAKQDYYHITMPIISENEPVYELNCLAKKLGVKFKLEVKQDETNLSDQAVEQKIDMYWFRPGSMEGHTPECALPIKFLNKLDCSLEISSDKIPKENSYEYTVIFNNLVGLILNFMKDNDVKICL